MIWDFFKRKEKKWCGSKQKQKIIIKNCEKKCCEEYKKNYKNIARLICVLQIEKMWEKDGKRIKDRKRIKDKKGRKERKVKYLMIKNTLKAVKFKMKSNWIKLL